jgi:hypothetical protein
VNFLEVIGLKQELYGPFWVPITLMFTLFVTSSLLESLKSYMDGKPYSYKFIRLTHAVFTVGIYAFAFPIALWGVSKYYARPVRFLDLTAVYGYGVTLWIPVTVLQPI